MGNRMRESARAAGGSLENPVVGPRIFLVASRTHWCPGYFVVVTARIGFR